MKLPILVSAALLLAQVGGNGGPQTPKFNVEGIVIRMGTGDAVPGARVTLTRTGGPSGNVSGGRALPAPVAGTSNLIPAGVRGAPLNVPAIPAVVTISTGKFSFPNIDEGSYSLQVQANGYLPQNYGQRFPGGPGLPIRLTAGQTPSSLSITLIPAGNISGRIRDRSDMPLGSVSVQLLRYGFNSQGQRTYQSMGTTKTNDRGEFRFYWMTPGRYYLLAGTPSGSLDPELAMMAAALGGATNANQMDVPLGYAFYPGVNEIQAATVIDLQPGADLSGLHLTLTPRPQTFRIRGRIVDSRTGQAPQSAVVSASPQIPGLNAILDGRSISGGLNRSSRNYDAKTGTFELKDLLPGAYLVTAAVQDPSPNGNRGGAFDQNGQPLGRSIGTTTVVIPESDVDGAFITVVPAATISGRIRIEGQLQPPMTMERLRAQLTLITPFASGPTNANLSSTAKPDGTFQITNVPAGDYRLVLAAPGSTGAAYLKDARFENTDAISAPLRVSGSGALDIVVGVAGSRLVGTLTDQRSQPVPVSQVILVPDRSRDRFDLFKNVVTDDKGGFIFAGIPPGDYKVFSWEGLEPNSWFDPELLSASETKGHTVHVTETSMDTIEVKMIPAGGTR